MKKHDLIKDSSLIAQNQIKIWADLLGIKDGELIEFLIKEYKANGLNESIDEYLEIDFDNFKTDLFCLKSILFDLDELKKISRKIFEIGEIFQAWEPKLPTESLSIIGKYNYASEFSDFDSLTITPKLSKLKKILIASVGEIFLELKHCSQIEEIYIFQNTVEKLDFRWSPRLKSICCEFSLIDKFSALDLPLLEKFWVPNCDDFVNPNWHADSNLNFSQIIDLCESPKLTKLSVQGRRIGEIDLAVFPRLEEFDIRKNPIKKIDFSNNYEITNLYIDNTKIKEIDLSHVKKLEYIEFGSKYLEKIFLSKDCKVSPREDAYFQKIIQYV